MGWDKELKDYRYYLKLEKKLSDNTVRAYLHDLSQIADYMEREFSIAEPELVTAGQIEMFLSHLYDTGVEKATQARVLSGIKSFFNYLMLNDRIEALPTEFIDAPKIGRKLPDVLSFDEVNAIIGSVDLSNRFGHRNKAMLETALQLRPARQRTGDVAHQRPLFQGRIYPCNRQRRQAAVGAGQFHGGPVDRILSRSAGFAAGG